MKTAESRLGFVWIYHLPLLSLFWMTSYRHHTLGAILFSANLSWYFFILIDLCILIDPLLSSIHIVLLLYTVLSTVMALNLVVLFLLLLIRSNEPWERNPLLIDFGLVFENVLCSLSRIELKVLES